MDASLHPPFQPSSSKRRGRPARGCCSRPSRAIFSQIWRPTELASVDAEIGKKAAHFLLNLIHPRRKVVGVSAGERLGEEAEADGLATPALQLLHSRSAGGGNGFINQCAAHGFYQQRHCASWIAFRMGSMPHCATIHASYRRANRRSIGARNAATALSPAFAPRSNLTKPRTIDGYAGS